MIRITDVVDFMEDIAPRSLAEEWDNVGLQVGEMDLPVTNLWVALDPLPDVVRAAGEDGANLLITHHPLLFKPLTTIDFSTPVGSIIKMAVQYNLAIYTAHTNLDSAAGGLNDILARRIGLTQLRPLTTPPGFEGVGLGRIGTFHDALRLVELAHKIKTAINPGITRYAGDPDLIVKTAAVCTGSGASLLPAFLNTEAQVYISGDLRYHDARSVENESRGLIDIGHFASEHLVVESLAQRLREYVAKAGASVRITGCTLETDPFNLVP